MPPQPQGAALHGWISAVWFGSVGGDEFDFGWGADPQTPDFMYFYVFIVIYINYLLLSCLLSAKGLGREKQKVEKTGGMSHISEAVVSTHIKPITVR